MKRLLALFLCLALLLGTFPALAAGGTASAPRADVTDTDAPHLISVKLAEKNKTLKPGNTIHLQVKLEDRSEIAECYAYFSNKSAGRNLCVELLYDAASDSFKGEYTLEKGDINGQYLLYQIEATDRFDNLLYTFKENGYAKFKLSGGSKVTTLGVTAVIKENGKTVKPGDAVHVEFKLNKKHPEASSMVFALAYAKTGEKTWYSVDFSPTGTKFSRVFTFVKEMDNGKYTLDTVELYDDDYRLVSSKKITGQSVTLSGAGKRDKTPPKFSSPSIKENKKKLTAGDTVHVSVRITDKSHIDMAYAYLQPQNGRSYADEKTKEVTIRGAYSRTVPLSYNSGAKKWEGSYTLPDNMPDGKYILSLYAYDAQGNSASKNYPKQYITFSSPDVVDEGMALFIRVCWDAIWGNMPTDAEIQQYGQPLASGKQKAVNVIKTLMQKSGLSGESPANALSLIMHGSLPDSAKKAKITEALKTSLDCAIDSLNDATFRQRCKEEWGIKPGNLGTKAADTKVDSVDVADGHYLLKGGKAVFAGVTNKNVKELTVKDTVSANGKTYKVTSIQGSACQDLKKLAKVTIGKNVTGIGQYAFSGCKKLYLIIIRTTKLSSVGQNAFSGIKSTAVFVCPKKQLKKYQKLIMDKGKAPKKAKFEDKLRQ